MIKTIANWAMLILLCSLLIITSKEEEVIDTYPDNRVYVLDIRQPDFLTSNNPEEYLDEALEYYNILHKDIVYAQAILETGYFKSRVCREYNNLFGLYNSRTKDYYRFEHWSESVVAYIKYIQYRYRSPTDYYTFLDSIGYATDPQYIIKLKKLVNKYEEN